MKGGPTRVWRWIRRALTSWFYDSPPPHPLVYVCVWAQLCLTLCSPRDGTCLTSLSVEFCRQKSRSGLPFPTLGDFPDQWWNPRLLHLLHWQVDSLLLEPPGKPNAGMDIMDSWIEIGSMFSKQMWWKVLRWDGMNERHSKGI